MITEEDTLTIKNETGMTFKGAKVDIPEITETKTPKNGVTKME